MQLTNIVTKRTRSLDIDADYPQAVIGGGTLYVRNRNGIARVNLADLTQEDVPDSATAGNLTATADGALVFDTGAALAMWQPGWETSRPIKTGNFTNVTSFAVRQR